MEILEEIAQKRKERVSISNNNSYLWLIFSSDIAYNHRISTDYEDFDILKNIGQHSFWLGHCHKQPQIYIMQRKFSPSEMIYMTKQAWSACVEFFPKTLYRVSL